MRAGTANYPGLLLVSGLLALSQGCGEGSGSRAAPDSLRARANAITEALAFEGAAVIEGMPRIQDQVLDISPGLETIESPFQLVEGLDFSLRLVIRPADVAKVRGATLMLDYADRYLDIPLEVDLEAGTAAAHGVLEAGSGMLGTSTSAQIGLYDDDGILGNYVPIPINPTSEAGPLAFDLLTLAQHAYRVTALAFTAQGSDTLLVSGSDDRTLAIWDLAQQRLRNRLEGHTARVLSVAATSDGARIASGSQDNSVRVWDGITGDSLATFDGHSDFVQAVTFSPDDSLLASGGWDGAVLVRQLEDGSLVQTLAPGDRVNALAFSPDGSRLAAGLGTLVHPGGVLLWRTDDWSEASRVDLGGRATALAFSPDGSLLATAYDRGQVRVWETATGAVVLNLHDPSRDTFSALAFQPGQPDRLLGVTLNGVAVGWSTTTGEVLIRIRTDRAYTSAAFSPDGAWLALGKFPEGATRLLRLSDLGF